MRDARGEYVTLDRRYFLGDSVNLNNRKANNV